MTYFRQRGFGSKLLRRVQRHRATTALFRSPTEPEALAYEAQPPAVQSDVPVVQATLALPQATPTTDVPIVQAAPRPLPPISRPPQAPAPFVPIPLPNTAATPARPTLPAITPVMPAAENITPPSPEPEPVPVVEDSDTAITEDVWRRLTTISRKHREKQDEEAELEAQQADALEAPEPALMPSRPERGIVEMPLSKPEPTSVQRSPEAPQVTIPNEEGAQIEDEEQLSDPASLLVAGETPSAETTIESATPEPVASPTIQRTPTVEPAQEAPTAEAGSIPKAVPQTTSPVVQHEAATEAGKAEVLDVAPTAATTEATVPGDAQIEQAPEAPAQEQSASLTPQASIVTPDTVAPTPVTVDTPASTLLRSEEETPAETAHIEEPEAAPTQVQAPLEQTLAADNAFGFQVTRTPQATVQAEPEVKRLPSAPRPVNDADHQELHTTLQNIEAGRPTDSSIEVIPPRRPRPESVMHAPRIQRRPQVEQATATETNDGESVALKVAEAPTVETPIGSLPSDLWTLIDAPVPHTATPLSATQPIAEGRTRSAPPQVQAQMSTRAPAAAATPIQRLMTQQETPNVQRTTPQASPVQAISRTPGIQRDVAIDQVETQAEEQPDRTSGDEDTAQAPAEPVDDTQTQQEEQAPTAGETDLDALAAQVYKRIKRKLSIEWERLRSRF